MIPKGHNTGKWRLTTDLSFPEGASVNDDIDPSLCSLKYTTVEKVARIIVGLGTGALLAKVDIDAAYRLIPVHPQDRPLQAVQWKDHILVDPMLPFSLRSSPKIFNVITDTLEWILRQRGIRFCEHYLDDFILAGHPDTQECHQALAPLDAVCNWLRVPMAPHKREGPTTNLTFLGIEINTVKGELRLPKDKLHRLARLLNQWAARKAGMVKEIQSLVGHLNHACKVIHLGRSFLRRLIDLLQCLLVRRQRVSAIRLNRGFRVDLAWWIEFLTSWNGTSFLYPPESLPAIYFTSDASGAWGCRAWCNNHWLQMPWNNQANRLDIACKELISIILACAVWGQEWAGHRVTCYCDNQVVAASIRSRSSKQPHLMHLLRCLAFAEVSLNFIVHPVYISTKANHMADDLSHNRQLTPVVSLNAFELLLLLLASKASETLSGVYKFELVRYIYIYICMEVRMP